MTKRGVLKIFYYFIAFIIAFPASAQHPQLHPNQQPQAKSPFPEYHKYTNWKSRIKIDTYKIDTLLHPVPMARQIFHDRIDREQMVADKSDRLLDTFIMYKNDTALSVGITQALICNVDTMEIQIENMPREGRDSLEANQQKIKYLRAVWELLSSFNNDQRPDPAFYIALEDNMDSMIVAINKHKLMAFVKANPNIYSLENGKFLFDKQSAARAYVYEQMGMSDPLRMIRRLNEYANDTFAAKIIAAAAPLVPNLIFDYATSTDLPIKSAVYRTPDSLVQAIVKIAAFSHAPSKIFPFLSDVYRGRKTVEELDSIVARPNLYFENLVRLKMENDSIARRTYNQEIEYRALKYFIRPMNEQHEEPDAVRFRCIDSLPATSLYYMMVCGQDEIYTSSFLGSFRKMMEHMQPLKANQLLDTLHYDRFRTFIRMCANYNTLTDFLMAMDDTARSNVMTRFISGLENGPENDLEDAVDVADAFGSIRDSVLIAFLDAKVKENYEASYNEHSRKGVIVYSLLARLFESNRIADNDTGISQVSSKLHLPAINKVLYKDLVNDSGIVYQQVFFFGDKDGKGSYDSYLTEFRDTKKWKVEQDSAWTKISSITGKKIIIYANLPLDEPRDENAIDSLSRFLADSGIRPTIIIHRGHSYHLKATLAKVGPSARIIVLGSCGGYHNLALVLDRAPDAHIISSKQTGTMAVNEPIIEALNQRLLNGEDVNWVAMWQELNTYFLDKPEAQDKFSDYVPPYKNLGAIFIKAYRKMMER